MTSGTGQAPTSRRAELARARQSRRPSRLGLQAGATPTPDRVLDPSAGFPSLLAHVWAEAAAAPDIDSTVNTLLTLADHVPADIQLRALTTTEAAALAVLRDMAPHPEDPDTGPTPEPPVFRGEIGLTTTGRVVVGVPNATTVASRHDLVDGVLQIPWTLADIQQYRQRVRHARADYAKSVADCRNWLDAVSPAARDELLDELMDAARRTAPFVFYHQDRLYTNFRERNNLTGKTLFPGHSDCVLSALRGVPSWQWLGSDAVLVVSLMLLIRSSGYARIEEANGTQVTLAHVAELLDRTRRTYNAVPTGTQVAPAARTDVESLQELAANLRTRRGELTGHVRLYREIHGPLMHKIERIAAPVGPVAHERETVMCAQLRNRLPFSGNDFDELEAAVAADPGWLIRPHGDFGTGLESLIYETVIAARTSFDADFAMSRGMRSLTGLIQALRAEDWARITGWELPEFFCCVVPAPEARRYFGDTAAQLADIAWSMSARMQYNSWHFLAGNLPRVPVVVDRDYFVPPSIPDIAYYSDQHHHGHVAARVRFSIRSPQPVEIDGRRFGGFVDLRLLRCESNPFTEQELLAAHRASAFIAAATSRAARLAADNNVLVTAFDPAWHWATITAATPVPTDA